MATESSRNIEICRKTTSTIHSIQQGGGEKVTEQEVREANSESAMYSM